jgi:KGK domain
MTDRSKQIISDTDTIVCLLDKAIIEFLNSHDTYKTKSLFQQLWKLNSTKNSVDNGGLKILEEVLKKVYYNQIENSEIAQKIDNFIKENKNKNFKALEPSTIEPFFVDGVNCNLLQPDGKGWQKGKLKICFEFIPEEPESVESQKNPIETHQSPLDEIRNSLVESNEDRGLNNLELLHPFQSRGNS